MMKINKRKQISIWQKNAKKGIVFFRPYDNPTPRTMKEAESGNHFTNIKALLSL